MLQVAPDYDKVGTLSLVFLTTVLHFYVISPADWNRVRKLRTFQQA